MIDNIVLLIVWVAGLASAVYIHKIEPSWSWYNYYVLAVSILVTICRFLF